MIPSKMKMMLILILTCLHIASTQKSVMERSVVHFPDDDTKDPPLDGSSNPSGFYFVPAQSAWRFQNDNVNNNNNRLTKVPSSGLTAPNRPEGPPTGNGNKKGRKAQPDVQDIISGIVHLLGGKVNVKAAASSEVPVEMTPSAVAAATRPVQQSTRINNRAPPRLTEVPFEAIPLEMGNSAAGQNGPPQNSGSINQQLPFGVPIRPPLWPPTSGQQNLPFGASGGIPLPIQLVPPVTPANRPWPPPSTEAPTTTTTETIKNVTKPLPPYSGPTISFFPEDHNVRHPPADQTVPPPADDVTLEPSMEEPSSPASPPLPTLDPSSITPPLAVETSWTTTAPHSGLSGRPGQVFHDDTYLAGSVSAEPDVITLDDSRIHPSQHGDSFELVVTAAQNFGGGDSGPGSVVTEGKPYVIPVDIDQVRGGLAGAIQPSIVGGTADDSDQYVSIDGRKTYFNLFPTDVPEGPVPMVQATSLPNRQPVVNGGIGYAGVAYPAVAGEIDILPAKTPISSRPTRPTVPTQRPTPVLIRRPSTTPLGRIDACIVGDPNACLEPNESCQAEVDGSACSCRPGFGRKKTTDVCKALAGFLVSLRLDRLDNERLLWSPSYADSSSHDYKQLEWESNLAINSLMEMTPLSNHYIHSTVNKFYVIGNKVIVNASVFMDQSPETVSVTVRPTLQKQLSTVIQNRNYNLGLSRLWVDTQANPIPAILDLNECGSPELNDCSPDAECFNTPGSFTCHCRPGFSDPAPPEDVGRVGRQCNSCTKSYCNNRGECKIENGQKVCQCVGNFKGQQCELDGEVLGVAIGASVAAVIIIIMTLVLLCMWSRRWRQNQDKMVTPGGYMDQLKSMPFPAIMGMQADRIRWAQYAEAMASAHNLYATMNNSSQQHPNPLPPFFYAPIPVPANQGAEPAPPPVPPRNPAVTGGTGKTPVRQASSLPVALAVATSTASQMVSGIQDLARRISRKKRPAPQPDPVSVNPHLALISHPALGYPGAMSTMGRSSTLMTTVGGSTLPLVAAGQFQAPSRTRSGSVISYGKRSAPPPPPSNPPPGSGEMTSEESDDAAESDAPIQQQRSFHVPRPRTSRPPAQQPNNIYFEADSPGNQPSAAASGVASSMSQQVPPPRPAPRYFYR